MFFSLSKYPTTLDAKDTNAFVRSNGSVKRLSAKRSSFAVSGRSGSPNTTNVFMNERLFMIHVVIDTDTHQHPLFRRHMWFVEGNAPLMDLQSIAL